MFVAAALATILDTASIQEGDLPKTIPVVVVSYFPIDGDRIDIKATGDWGDTYAATKAKCENLTVELAQKLEEGSRFRGYKNPSAQPSLRYKVLQSYEFKKPLPTRPLKPGQGAPMTDYNAIMQAVDAKTWVEKKGVKQFWIWGYHGGKVGLWESNMASPFGDVSNSDRSTDDLPVFAKTYTVYHYNYQRGIGEAIEDHMHQLEALLNHVDGRDTAKPEDWPKLLFWGKFVGSDVSHKIATKPARCGWTHYAPNSESDYDWRNPREVESDIEDWQPDKPGKTQMISAAKWDFDPVKWRVYWLQAIPGGKHGLTYQGKPLRDWWMFVYDWDRAKRESWKLTR